MKKRLLLLHAIVLVLIQGASAQTTVQVGSLFENNMTTGFTVPLYRTGDPSTGQQTFSRHFFVYDQAALCKAQLNPGATITRLQWFKNGVGSNPGITHSFKIYMKNSNIAGTNGNSWTNLINGATKVFESDAFVVPVTSGWWEIELQTPFVYNGQTIEIYTDWSAGGTPNASLTGGLISFGQTTMSGGIDNIRRAGGSAKFSAFDDSEFVGGGLFTTNVTSNMVNLKLTQVGGVPRVEICGNGIDDDCDGLTDEAPCASHYRSRVTAGSWNDVNSWSIFSFASNTYINATVVPTENDLTINIMNTHTLTLNSSNSIDQLTVSAGGILSITAGGNLNLFNGSGNDLINNGTVQIQSGGQLTGAGTVLNNAGISLSNANLSAPVVNKNTINSSNSNSVGQISNDAILQLSSGTLTASATLLNNPSGAFDLGANNSFTGNITNTGFIRKVSTGISSINGTVTNTGSIIGIGTLNISNLTNTGVVSPGISATSAGALTLNSASVFSSTSKLQIDLHNGSGSGTGHDVLLSDGNLFLNGKLIVSEMAAMPAGSYEIVKVNAGVISGSFTDVILPDGYSIQFNTSNIIITKPEGLVAYPGPGNCAKFDGINSIALAPHNSNYNFTLNQNFTVDCWVRVPSAQQTDLSLTENVILEKWGSPFGGALPFSLNVVNSGADIGKLSFYRGNGTATLKNIISSVRVDDGRFHHIAMQKEGTELRLLVDGIIAGTTTDFTTGQTSNTNNLSIGSASDGSASFKGDVDEIRIWNTAVPQALIRTWMCKTINPEHPLLANLVTYFKFDHSIGGNTFLDMVSVNHGTLFSNATLAISGAALGTSSAADYSATPSALLVLPNGESMSATSSNGTLTGIHVYSVDSKPSNGNGVVGLGGNNRYFGVHTAGSANPEYQGVYNYGNNPFIGNETGLKLFKRNANDATQWDEVTATLNTTDNTFSFTGNFTEYILGNLGVVLPVNLLSFSGMQLSANARLQWLTANEMNLSHFELQRSFDGASFDAIAQIAAGNINYSYTDTAVFNTKQLVFYRLASIDQDGSAKISNILRLQKIVSGVITIYPNPVKDILSISGLQQNTILRLLNTDGKLLTQQTVSAQTITLDISRYTKGVYLLQCIAGDEMSIQKIIKQ